MADLRSLAEAADEHDHASAYLFDCSRCAYIAAADPQTILELIDSRDDAWAVSDSRIRELEAALEGLLSWAERDEELEPHWIAEEPIAIAEARAALRQHGGKA